MRFFRYLFVTAVFCGLTGMAGATPIDFHMNVLDPPPPSFMVNSIFTLPFSISFSPCGAGELPGGMTADGCFAGQNLTGLSWTNLQLIFSNTPALASQAASCGDPGSPFSIFQVATCSLSPDGASYILRFSGGIIVPGDFFFIAETGPSPTAFGVGSGSVTFIPEPVSLLLLSSGFMMFGLLLYTERRRGLFRSRQS